MHIYWYGQTSIKIQDNGVTIAIDPYKEAAIRSPRMAADILLLTSDKLKSAASAISGDKFTIDSPGEYEAKGIFINGVSNNGSGQTFFFLDINGLTVGHLGNISKGELSSKQLEMFENVDILLMPVGEDAKISSKLVNQIEPKILIPMLYKIPKVKDKLDTLDNFTKQVGVKAESMDKLVIKKKDIPQEDMQMIILTPQK
ncbi:MBL fold metallo-hydrolase [Patescibacteria group bacterium]|nr:MBL fold metallo-hydrolase [Patescibacteria group bacterium]